MLVFPFYYYTSPDHLMHYLYTKHIQCFGHLSISMNIWHRFHPTDILWKTKLWTSYLMTCLKKQSLICASLISLQSASNHFLLRLKNWLQLLCRSLQLVLINKKMPPLDLILHQNLILVEVNSKSVVLIIRH